MYFLLPSFSNPCTFIKYIYIFIYTFLANEQNNFHSNNNRVASNQSGMARHPEKLEDWLARLGDIGHASNIACCVFVTKRKVDRVSYAVNYPLLISQR